MTKEERLKSMVWGLPKGHTPRHCKVAAEVLDRLAAELGKQGFKFRDDDLWPYHLLVPSSSRRFISLYCGGFRKTIEIQQLKEDGTADTRFKEASFGTPKGAVNYLGRRS